MLMAKKFYSIPSKLLKEKDFEGNLQAIFVETNLKKKEMAAKLILKTHKNLRLENI